MGVEEEEEAIVKVDVEKYVVITEYLPSSKIPSNLSMEELAETVEEKNEEEGEEVSEVTHYSTPTTTTYPPHTTPLYPPWSSEGWC